MKNRNKKVVTTQEFMAKARDAIKHQDEVANLITLLGSHLEEILSDGQKQQIDLFLARLNEAKK